MQNLEVGKPYKEGLKRIPEEIIFNFDQDGGFLRIVFDSPLDSEIKEITQGKIKLGLSEEDGILFFFIKFGELPWMDTPYNVEFSQPFDLEELTDEKTGYVVQIVLIDGMTGIVHILKLIELPHAMSKRFKELVEKQKETRIRDYETVLYRIYSKYETDALVEEVEIYFL
jgi:hypothetical protein